MTDDRYRQIEHAIADLEAQIGTFPTVQQVYQIVKGNFPEVATHMRELRERRAAQSAASPAESPQMAPASVATLELPAPPPAAVAVLEPGEADAPDQVPPDVASHEPIVPDWTAAQAMQQEVERRRILLAMRTAELEGIQEAVDKAVLALVIGERRRVAGLLHERDPRLDQATQAVRALQQRYDEAMARRERAGRDLQGAIQRLTDARAEATQAAQQRWLLQHYPTLGADIETAQQLATRGFRGGELMVLEARQALYAHQHEAPTWAEDGPRA